MASREEQQARRREEQAAKDAARAERDSARAGKRRRAKKTEPAENEKRRQKERLAPEIIARISQYGVTPDERSDADPSTEPPLAEPNQQEDAE